MLPIPEILVFLFTLVVLAFLYCKYKYSYWSKRGVYTLKPSIPFGNTKPLILQKEALGVVFHDLYFELKNKGLPYAGCYSLTKPILLVRDLDLIKLILTKEFQSFHDRDIYMDEEADPLTGNLLFQRGIKWKNLRNKLSPTFTSGKMKMMFKTFLSCAEHLVETMDKETLNQDAVDIRDILARFTTDIIGSTAFGLDCNSLTDPNSEFRKYGNMIFISDLRDSLTRMLTFSCPSLIKLFGLKTFRPEVNNFFFNVFKQTVEYREKNEVDRKDFMNLLIRLKNNQSVEEDRSDIKVNPNGESEFTMDELTAQAFVFFFAGFETSSSTMTFTLLEISQNQQIQNKLRDDINNVLKKHNGEITYEAVMEMSYLDKVIKETLRKYPSAPILNRKCMKTFKIPNTNITLQKNDTVFVPIMGIHRDPDYFPDPLKFDPERFNDEEKSNRNAYTYMPFGEGPRNCIGMRFGLLQTKVGLVTLITHYKFELNPATKPIRYDPSNFLLMNLNKILFKITKVY